jgi:hypothetical protein
MKARRCPRVYSGREATPVIRLFANVLTQLQQELSRISLGYAIVLLLLAALCGAAIIAMRNDANRT